MELFDYVVNTPQNTNKTILKQLVNNEKNKAVYESVEELKKSGQVGYEEPAVTKKVFEGTVPADGSKVTIDCPPTAVSGDEALDVRATVDGKTYDCYLYLGNGGDALVVRDDDYPNDDFPLIIESWYPSYSGSTGWYTAESFDVKYKNPNELDTDGYVIVEIPIKKATIHTIDPKYLPSTVPNIQTAEVGQAIVVKAVDANGKPTEWEAASVVMPVVELNTVISTSENTVLSADDARLTKLSENATPIIVTFTITGDNAVNGRHTVVTYMDTYNRSFEVRYGNYVFKIKYSGGAGGWLAYPTKLATA